MGHGWRKPIIHSDISSKWRFPKSSLLGQQRCCTLQKSIGPHYDTQAALNILTPFIHKLSSSFPTLSLQTYKLFLATSFLLQFFLYTTPKLNPPQKMLKTVNSVSQTLLWFPFACTKNSKLTTPDFLGFPDLSSVITQME